MEDFCNLSENFIREIRHILIYDADALTFNANLRGDYPNLESYIYKISVHTPSAYKRRVQLKKKNKNDYLDININIPIYDLSAESRDKLYSLHARRRYVIVFSSNKDRMVLGNSRERLHIEILDGIRDDATGKDHFVLKIKGETTIKPNIRKVTPAFRVLLFAPPLL